MPGIHVPRQTSSPDEFKARYVLNTRHEGQTILPRFPAGAALRGADRHPRPGVWHRHSRLVGDSRIRRAVGDHPRLPRSVSLKRRRFGPCHLVIVVFVGAGGHSACGHPRSPPMAREQGIARGVMPARPAPTTLVQYNFRHMAISQAFAMLLTGRTLSCVSATAHIVQPLSEFGE